MNFSIRYEIVIKFHFDLSTISNLIKFIKKFFLLINFLFSAFLALQQNVLFLKVWLFSSFKKNFEEYSKTDFISIAVSFFFFKWRILGDWRFAKFKIKSTKFSPYHYPTKFEFFQTDILWCLHINILRTLKLWTPNKRLIPWKTFQTKN